jgi:hypothetical protein
MLSLFLVGLVMSAVALLFHRSFQVLRTLDAKERTRQAARMGLDRLTCELREATAISTVGASILGFEKIDPAAVAEVPPPVPEPIPDDFTAPVWTAQNAYPDSARLEVEYEASDENLLRRVRAKGGGAWGEQVVVSGVNSFNCVENADNEGEVEVTVMVLDNRRAMTLTSRVLCPCIREPFQ